MEKKHSSKENVTDKYYPDIPFSVNYMKDKSDKTNNYFGKTTYNDTFEVWKPHISIIKKLSNDITFDEEIKQNLDTKLNNMDNQNFNLKRYIRCIKIMYDNTMYTLKFDSNCKLKNMDSSVRQPNYVGNNL